MRNEFYPLAGIFFDVNGFSVRFHEFEKIFDTHFLFSCKFFWVLFPSFLFFLFFWLFGFLTKAEIGIGGMERKWREEKKMF